MINPENASLLGEVITNETASSGIAIIGTRIPDEAQAQIAFALANILSLLGHPVRTGAAYGIDQKAMEGSKGLHLEVFLPWETYNQSIIPASANITVYDPAVHIAWTESVREYHPNYKRLSRGAFALHARNFGIISGCKGVIALPREDGQGGTAQGIRIANHLKIPVAQANTGSISDIPRWMGNALKTIGVVSQEIHQTYRPSELQSKEI